MIQLFLSFIRRLLGCILGDGEAAAQTAASTIVLEPLAVKEDNDPVQPPSDTQKEEDPPQETNDATSTDPGGASCSRAFRSSRTFSRARRGGRHRTVIFQHGKGGRRRATAKGNQKKPKAPPYANAVIHNMHHSFFHRLPLDLLYYLAKHHIHASADLLALGASTRALLFSPMADAPWLDPPQPCLTTLRDFLKRLRRDDFMRACAAEEEQQQLGGFERKHPRPTVHNGGSESLVPCGACQSMHRRSFVSDAQLAARTHASRRCKGSAGIVRLCPHATTDLAQLSALEEMNPRGVWCVCRECVQPQYFTVLSSTIPSAAPGMDFWVWRKVVVDEDIAAGGDGSSSGSSSAVVADPETHLTPEMALGVLKAAAERYGVVACNHMRLDDPETFKSKFWTPNRIGRYMHHDTTYRCRTRTCRGYVEVFWLYSPTASGFFRRDTVQLNVRRLLRHSRSAEDKEWLAQIENLEEM